MPVLAKELPITQVPLIAALLLKLCVSHAYSLHLKQSSLCAGAIPMLADRRYLSGIRLNDQYVRSRKKRCLAWRGKLRYYDRNRLQFDKLLTHDEKIGRAHV